MLVSDVLHHPPLRILKLCKLCKLAHDILQLFGCPRWIFLHESPLTCARTHAQMIHTQKFICIRREYPYATNYFALEENQKFTLTTVHSCKMNALLTCHLRNNRTEDVPFLQIPFAYAKFLFAPSGPSFALPQAIFQESLLDLVIHVGYVQSACTGSRSERGR